MHCALCNDCCYSVSIRHLDIRQDEHTDVSPLTGKMVKAAAVLDHSFQCNYVASFDKFDILARKIKKHPFEIKEIF